MDGHFETELIHLDGDAVLMAIGEIDASTSPILLAACLDLTSVCDRLVLDFAGVTFMDSSGLHVLIQIERREDTTSVVIRNAPDQVRRLLQITNLATQFLESLASQPDDAETARATTQLAESSEI
jgi:anti-sigma B factor antagonist